MKGFLMTPAVAEKFFKLCAELGAETEQERLDILSRMIHEEDIKILNEKGLKKTLEGKKVLRVKNNE